MSEAIFTAIVENLSPDPPRMARCVGDDTYIPLGNAWRHVLPSEESIVASALELVLGRAPVGKSP
jgi:hypothetical protein